jgi:hypothetical protein
VTWDVSAGDDEAGRGERCSRHDHEWNECGQARFLGLIMFPEGV